MTPLDFVLNPVLLSGSGFLLGGSNCVCYLYGGVGTLFSGVVRLDWFGVATFRWRKNPGPVLRCTEITGDGSLGYLGFSSPVVPISLLLRLSGVGSFSPAGRCMSGSS